MLRAFGGGLFACVAVLGLFWGHSPVHGAVTTYPDQGPISPGYMFTNIRESSGTDPVPLYGPPTAFPIGLVFSPADFDAVSAGGGADLIDGQLNYTVSTMQTSLGIPMISFNEGGSFSLTGTGTATTQVSVGAVLRATIMEINGALVAPINLTPSTASLTYTLADNPGSAQTWNLSVTVNIAAQLALLGYAPNQLATKAEVVIDNTLVAISEGASTARIAKGDFDIHLAPEPASGALLAMALAGLRFAQRRRSRC